MRRIVLWLAATVTVVVLLFGYHTSTNRNVVAGQTGTTGAAPSQSQPSAPGPSASSPSSGLGSGVTKTYTGSVAQTQWGPVQVRITVASGKITAVDVVQSPNGNRRDLEINDQALPILVQETIQAQSAQIDMVSGATITSDGYVRSLQAALDEAGI